METDPSDVNSLPHPMSHTDTYAAESAVISDTQAIKCEYDSSDNADSVENDNFVQHFVRVEGCNMTIYLYMNGFRIKGSDMDDKQLPCNISIDIPKALRLFDILGYKREDIQIDMDLDGLDETVFVSKNLTPDPNQLVYKTDEYESLYDVYVNEMAAIAETDPNNDDLPTEMCKNDDANEYDVNIHQPADSVAQKTWKRDKLIVKLKSRRKGVNPLKRKKTSIKKDAQNVSWQTMSTTNDDTHTCCVCGYIAGSKKQFKIHMKTHAREKFPCPTCPRTFSAQSKLTRHIRTHTGERPFMCSVCGRCFTDQSSLRMHTVIHTSENHLQCTICNQSFAAQSKLSRHMRIHTGEKPFMCSVCGRCFTDESSLRMHGLTHTGEKNFTCPVCGRCFARKSHLTSHTLIHTGERPYQCTICGRQFPAQSQLNRHVKTIHTGEKSFCCIICGVGFAQRSALKVHEQTHSGDRPYPCHVCGRRYSQRKYMVRHMAKVHISVGDGASEHQSKVVGTEDQSGGAATGHQSVPVESENQSVGAMATEHQFVAGVANESIGIVTTEHQSQAPVATRNPSVADMATEHQFLASVATEDQSVGVMTDEYQSQAPGATRNLSVSAMETENHDKLVERVATMAAMASEYRSLAPVAVENRSVAPMPTEIQRVEPAKTEQQSLAMVASDKSKQSCHY